MWWRNSSSQNTCARAQRLLCDRSCGLLRPADERWLAQHLAQCPTCAAEAQVLQRVIDLVDSVPPLPPSPGLWGAVERRIASEQLARQDRRARWRPVVPALATSVALALIALASFNDNAPEPLAAPPPESLAYIQSHVLATSTDPLADRVGLVSYATMTARSGFGEGFDR